MASNDILYFHSKSKSAEGKHLSNFALVDGGLTFANFEGKWDSEEKLKGKVFPSIEHAFQGVKFAMVVLADTDRLAPPFVATPPVAFFAAAAVLERDAVVVVLFLFTV